jgi:hypothetical protein
MMRRRVVASSLAGLFFLLASPVLATEDLYTDAINVLKNMEEKSAAVRMCGAGLLEKGKETRFVFETIIETCACCPDVYRCCYTLACKPCPEMEVQKELDKIFDKAKQVD